VRVHRYTSFLLLLPWPWVCANRAAPAQPETAAQAVVQRALANELLAARSAGHPIRYTLRKTSPRLTSTKLLIETKDGLVARLVSINDQALSAADNKKELDRLDGLLADPGRQKHRKDSEDADTARAMKVLRALPGAFLYQPADPDPAAPAGQAPLMRFTFSPNPAFDAPDLETEVLKEMTGEVWVDPAQARVTRLEGHLRRDVDFGWGILGKLNKGGWIVIEQADIGGGQWHIVRFEMQMTGRVLFKSRVFDTVEVESDFVPVPLGLSYQKAIEMLRASEAPQERASH